jgi:hypothetical protein
MRYLLFLLNVLLVIIFSVVNSTAATFVDTTHGTQFTCTTSCHVVHGSGGSTLLGGADAETTCLSCHGPGGIATKKAAIHSPVGFAPEDITCLECHNPHSNRDYTDDGTNSAGTNVQLIGIEFDYNADPVVRYEFATIIEEPASDPRVPKKVIFKDSPADWTRSDGFGICQACHAAPHNEGLDCRGCHEHSKGFAGAGCTGCHDGSGAAGTAEAVSDSSSHALNDTGFTCEECHTAHSSGTIEIPNNSSVGINYGSNGEDGIALGSSTATGGTEAEICWNCHDTYGVSEWGTNTQVSTGSSPYDYGSVNPGAGIGWYADTTPGGEVGATWFSANFGYKSGAIQSMHSVDGTATTPGLDPVDNIRCSYCHDVHELNTLVNDNSSGKPYLRGTWMGNPYREDGAPFAGQTYASQGNFGAVPRGGVGATEMGGYQIDQNNDPNPTGQGGNTSLGWTADSSSGLCALCHGSNIGVDAGTWAAGDIDDMNYFDVDETGTSETPAVSWVGVNGNGHSNAVLGGSGVNASNIFREDWRKPNDGYCDPATGTDADGNNADADSYCAGYPNMAYQQLVAGSSNWAGGFRGAASLGDQGFRVEPLIGANQPFAYDDYNWGASVDVATVDSQYHQFSCSKCHNPHASRLPRLMMTNCLDLSHNSWDDASLTIVAGDVVTVSGAPTSGSQSCDTSVNAAHIVVGVDLASNAIFVDPASFSGSCSRKNITLNWNGTDYALPSVDFTDGGGAGGTDEITLNADIDMSNFIGRQVHNTGITNLAGKATIQVDNDGVMLTVATSAQNCHRYVDWNDNGDTSDAGDQKGWNNVTPW